MKIKNEKKSGRKIWIVVSTAAIALLMIAALYFTELLPYINGNRLCYDSVDWKTSGDYVALRDGDSFSQKIQLSSRFSGARLYLASVDGSPLRGKLNCDVYDAEGQQLGQTVAELQEEDGPLSVDLEWDKPLHTETGEYTLKVTLQGFAEDQVIAVFYTDNIPDFAEGTAFANNKDTGNNVLRNLLLDGQELKGLYWEIALTIWAAATGLSLFLTITRRDFAFQAAVCLFIVGVLYSFVFQPFNTPDENRHYGTAYYFVSTVFSSEVSSRDTAEITIPEMQGESMPVENYTLPVRGTDQGVFALSYDSFSASDYIRVKDALLSDGAETTQTDAIAKYPSFPDSPICYWPDVLGIWLGWKLHWNGLATVLSARIASLTVYTVLCYFSLKILPYGKAVFAVIQLLPLSGMLSISCANDSQILGIVCVCTALVLRASEERRNLRLGESAVFLLGMAYCVVARQYHILLLAVLLLVCAIWTNCSAQTRKRVAIGVGVTLSAVLILYFVLVLCGGISAAPTESNTPYGLGYLLGAPFDALAMIFQTIYRSGNRYFDQMLGGNLGWLNVEVGATFVVFFAFLLLFAVIDASADFAYSLPCRRAAVFIGVAMLLAVFAVGFKWTSPQQFEGAAFCLAGLQGRYFLPGTAVLLLAVRLPITTKKRFTQSLLQWGVAANAMVLWNCFMRIVIQ